MGFKFFATLTIAVSFFLFSPTTIKAAGAGSVASAAVECSGLKDAAAAALKTIANSGLTVPTDPVSLTAKEGCLDAIGYAIVKLLIQEIKNSILDWVNNGFEGSPAFLTNPEEFFSNIAKHEAEIFIREATRTASLVQKAQIRKVVRETVDKIRRRRTPQDPGQQSDPSQINQPPGSVVVGGVPVAGVPSGPFGNGGTPSTGAQTPFGGIATDDTVAQDIILESCRRQNEILRAEFLNKALVEGTSNAFVNTPEQYQLETIEIETSNSAQESIEFEEINCQDQLPKTAAEQEQIKREFARDFKAGSWAAWHSATQKPKNNPYGYELQLREEISKNQTFAIGIAQDKLNQGNGFLSQETCVERDIGPYDREELEAGTITLDQLPCLRKKVQTPGSVVLNQVNQITTSDLRSKEIADEFNEAVDEIFDAVLNQIIKKGLIAFRDTSFGQSPIGEDLAEALEDEARITEQTRDRNNEIRSAIRDIDLASRAFLIARRESVLVIDQIKTDTQFMSQLARCEDYKIQIEAQNEKTFRQLNDEYDEIQQFYLRQIGVVASTLEDLKVYADSLDGVGERVGTTELIREFSEIARDLPDQGDVRSAERTLLEEKEFSFELAKTPDGTVAECKKRELQDQAGF